MSHLLKKPLMESFTFLCSVLVLALQFYGVILRNIALCKILSALTHFSPVRHFI